MENGYAILFTIVVVSIISIISMGLASSALKQMILSGVARDSTTAFYEADLGSECALYADIQPPNGIEGLPNPWTCAGNSLVFTRTIISAVKTTYTLNPATTSDKCFYITATKTVEGDTIKTNIQTRGYNICDKSNSRTVERAIEISY